MSNKDTLRLNFNFHHVPVQSSMFLSAAWDQNTLQVRFTDGALYNYYNVDEQVYQDLIDPELKVSKGSYLYKSVIFPAGRPGSGIFYKRVK